MGDVSGFCAECGRLLPIQPSGFWPGTRNQRWLPIKHPRRGDDTGGEDCPGMTRPL
jgi:hypothetical protein